MTYVKISTIKKDINLFSIRKNSLVVIKPNLVKEFKENDHSEWESVITSPDLIKYVTELVAVALNGSGKIVICDAPQTDSSFSAILQLLDLSDFITYCSNKYKTPIEILDLRNEEWVNEKGIIVKRTKLIGDPNGVIRFNLGKDSHFYDYKGEGNYYGADYDEGEINRHHHAEIQEYLVCATPILADVFINMPKMKTHKKTGVTLNLKNLVGINADKNWLPHHTNGSPSTGGDQYPDLTLFRKAEQLSVKIARKVVLKIPGIGGVIAQNMRKMGTSVFGDTSQVIRSGNWYGNDTTWRMVLDLNRILLYGQADGTLNRLKKKHYFSVIDGIVAMEGNGPMTGTKKDCGIVISGEDPVACDLVAARAMGFDWRNIPVIYNALKPHLFPITQVGLNEIYVDSDNDKWSGKFLDIERNDFFSFKPHFGWKGMIEFQGSK